MQRRSIEPPAAVLAVLCFLDVAQPLAVWAGTTGKISGRVLDMQKRPVVAATVGLVGQPYGTFTTAEGQYNVLNVPAGTYDVRVSRVGYKPMVVQGVIVSADNTTRLDAQLEESAIRAEAVVVRATRLPVDVNLTSTRATLTAKDIQALPVQELQDVVNLQAGVVDGHFRGGRSDEVQFQVDGVSVNNAFDNKSSLRVDRSLLQEVQVISGTFDAEYGQAMSGVVNAVLKQGTPQFQWSAEILNGAFFFPERKKDRLMDTGVRPAAAQNYQLTLMGPLPLPKTVYLLSGRHYSFDDYVHGTRSFGIAPAVVGDSLTRHSVATVGDQQEMSLGYSREWSGALKVTNSSIPNAKLNYQALFNFVDGRRGDYRFRFNPDGLSKQHTFSIAHGVGWTHTLGKVTYFDVALRQNYIHYTDRVFDDLFDPRYDAAGTPHEDANVPGVVNWGVDFTRFEQRTNAWLLKGSVVSQVRQDQQLKAGAELQLPEVQFGAPGSLQDIGGRIVRHIDEPPDFPGVRTYWPVIGAAFVQDQIEWSDFTFRAGARFDYFDARATVPSDLANPANAIARAPESTPQGTTIKAVVSPRLGVAYPITERAGVHFAYGYFYQFPSIGEIFSNADYSVLARLQASTTNFGVMGNPDVKPEKTVQYEFGYKQALSQDFGFDVSAFYKDIRDLLGVEFISTYNDAEYARLTNVDFGNVLGVTIAVDHRQLGPVRFALDYTWQQARGNSSDPRETATRAANGGDPRPRVVAFDWDQRHTFNMTVALGREDLYSASMVLRAASGQPYTPVIAAGFGHGLETNSGRKPASFLVDLRAERQLGKRGMNLFGRVFNLFDTRYFNGAVFPSTGSPYYSRFPTPDRVALANPTRFYAPRRIEVGVTLSSELLGTKGGLR